MSAAPDTEIIGVFHDRNELEKAIEMLQSHGLERSQLTVLGTSDTIRERLGMEVAPPSEGTPDIQAPVDKSEEQNITPLLAGLPAYIGAMLAAGATVASGGALAGVAVAALAGGAGGALLGGGAAKLFRDQVEGAYEEHLQRGGILLLVTPRKAEDITHAKEILERYTERSFEKESGSPNPA